MMFPRNATAFLKLALTVGFLAFAAGSSAIADQSGEKPGAVIALRSLPAATVIAEGDVILGKKPARGALTSVDDAIGLETRVTIYAGRPIIAGDLRPPAIVERNQIVTLTFSQGRLLIRTDGRALDRGAEGDVVRVMNLSSRTIVSGAVIGASEVSVANRGRRTK